MKFFQKMPGLLCTVAFISFLILPASAVEPPVRILPLGDSITFGIGAPGDQGGYRNRLHTLLTNAGFNVDFVGTFADANNPTLPDVNHQGASGFQINQIRQGIPGWLKKTEDPDVILLHIGTNDITAGNDVATTTDRLKTLIGELATARPFAKIVVASLVPRTDNPAFENLQVAYNQEIPGVVADQAALGRQVYFVDLHAGLTGADLADGLHPSLAGYEKMADAWVPAVTSVITPLGTADPPGIANVDARTALNQVMVRFSKPLEDAAATPSFFTLSDGVTVSNAVLDATTKRVVTLTTSTQDAGKLYTLSVTGVRDRTPQLNVIPPGSIKLFTSQTLTDGSFEGGGMGWNLAGNQLVSGPTSIATQGEKLLAFNGGNLPATGTASQSFTTVVGETYRLTFDVGVNGAAVQQSMNMTLTGSTQLTSQPVMLNGPGGSATRWESRTFNFVANSITTTLAFQDTSSSTDSVDLLVDDVRVSVERTTPVLTITSTPSQGIPIGVTPNDLGGNNNGTTGFNRTYSSGVTVSLTAPLTSGSLFFQKWRQDGINHSFNTGASVVMNEDHTLEAVYGILSNGSFESGTVLSGNGGPGSVTELATWNPQGGGQQIGYVGDAQYAATDGGRLLVFNGGSNTFNGSVYQEFDTEIGQNYTLSLDVGIYSVGTAGKNQRLEYKIEGTGVLLTRQVVRSSVSGPDVIQWATVNQNFTANSTRTKLTLRDNSQGFAGSADSDLAVDDVRVVRRTSTQPPDSLNDNYEALQDVPLVVPAPGVLANETTSQSPVTTAVLSVGPLHGDLILDPSGAFSYTPDVGYFGTDSFTYRANDGSTDSALATVAITVLENTSGLLANGSFEAGGIVNENELKTQLANWTVTGNPTGYIVEGFYTSTELNRIAVFSSGGDVFGGTISQAIDTQPGQAYKLNLDLGVLGRLAAQQQLEVSVVGTTSRLNVIENLTVAHSFHKWYPRIYTFIADSEESVLTFTDNSAIFGTNAEQSDITLDKLSLVAIENVRTLTVNSSADAGYEIEVSPLDLGGNGGTTTNFTLSYEDDTVVTLTATPAVGPKVFDSWKKNGEFLTNDLTTIVTLDANTTLTAVYVTNNTPTTVADSFSATEDDTLTVVSPGVLSNDTDPNSAPLTAELVAEPTHGDVILSPGGGFSYVPDPNFSGDDTFTYIAENATDSSAITLVSITVNPVNDLPSAAPQSLSVVEDTAKPVTLVGTDGDGDLLTYTIVTAPVNGVLSGSGPDRIYTPTANFSGNDTFTFTVDDGTGATSPATVSITISPVNDAPLAVADAYTVVEEGFLTVPAAGILANDSDAELSSLTAILDTTTTHGGLTLQQNGTFTYQPFANYSGADSFTYRASDGTSTSGVTTVTITVTPVNDPPVATPQTLAVVEDTATSVTLAGTDPDGDPLTYVIVTAPANGVLSGTGSSRTFTPAANFNGSDSFTFTVNDGTGATAPATVSINISAVPDAPVAVANSYTVNEDTLLSVPAAGVLTNDTDADLSPLTAIQDVGPVHGTLNLASNGSFTYQPFANYSGPDSFTYRANDGLTSSNIATVSITVAAVNDASVATPQSLAVVEDVATPVTLTGTDADGDTLVYAIVTAPSRGVLSGTGSARTYTPGTNLNGADSFTFTVNDGSGASAPATVTINISPVADPPLASADSYNTAAGALLSVAAPGVLANDTDAEGSPLTASLVASTTQGVLNFASNGSFTYQPAANYTGPDSFTYRANDGTANSEVATVSINVTSAGGFSQWLASFGASGGGGEDFDEDSIDNGVEYVIGGNPGAISNPNLLPTVALVNEDPDGNLTFSNYVLFTYRRTDLANADSNTSIVAEWNTGLAGAWSPASGASGVVIQTDNNFFPPSTDRMRVYLPRSLAAPGGPLFARLKVVVQTP